MASSLPPPPPRDPATPQHRHSHQPTSTTPRHHRERSANPRRKSVHSRHRSLSSASSPEVITNLVDSLSKLSPGPLENPALYGTLAPPPLPSHRRDHSEYDYTVGIGREHAFLHPDDAALAPVVRTAKPPSGFSVHTNGSNDSGRSSYSGISVGKGGVDIPNYVRNYMNGAAGPGKSLHERKNSRESGKSSRRDGSRLNYVSSKERIKMEKARELERERENERELRMSVGGVLSATGGIDTAGKGKGVAEDITRHIPQRSSSYGKGSPHNSRSYPAALVTGTAPMHMTPPLGSPLFAPGGSPYEEDEDGDAAPAPDLPKTRPEKAKRNSKQGAYPKRSDSLRAPANRSPSKAKRKSDPAPHGIYSQASPPRPSFQSTPEQRPSSADSIDDAVDAYLCSPRLSQKIRMPTTGRVISFSEVGDPSGFAVFVCVGMGLTRYVTAFYDELALTLGLRLITPDRPGVGESDPIDEAERTVLNWPDDVLYICQSLKITKFSILAHSAGAIYALATALRMPGHIHGKIHLLAPWIPPSQMEGVVSSGTEKGEKVGSVPTSQRILRALPTPILKAANSSFMSATSSSLTTSLPRTGGKSRKKPSRNSSNEAKDAAKAAVAAAAKGDGEASSSGTTSSPNATKDGEASGEAPEKAPEMDAFAAALASVAEKERQMTYDERLTHAIWTLSTRNANPAVDLLVCLERNRPVGFRYVDITRDVVIHHGTKDTRVPVENVKWLGKTMKGCEVRVLANEGHGLMASAMVMGSVLDEIATEWRDWKKFAEGREVQVAGAERRWVE